MPAIARIGDMSTSDPCGAPERPIISGASTVFMDGKPVAVIGSQLAPHACPGASPHSAVISSSSGSIFVEGKPIARVGDGISCGSKVKTGSPTCSGN
jgi:uncharacterized Zn-binding protein involved in type VI secretion